MHDPLGHRKWIIGLSSLWRGLLQRLLTCLFKGENHLVSLAGIKWMTVPDERPTEDRLDKNNHWRLAVTDFFHFNFTVITFLCDFVAPVHPGGQSNMQNHKLHKWWGMHQTLRHQKWRKSICSMVDLQQEVYVYVFFFYWFHTIIKCNDLRMTATNLYVVMGWVNNTVWSCRTFADL